MRCLVVVILGSGCGFLHGGLSRDVDASTDVDGPGDGVSADGSGDASITPANCYSKWFDGTISFNTPIALTTVNSPVYDRDPFLLPDELTIFISSDRTGSMGSDVWMATRTNITGTFSTPVEAAWFNSTVNESKLSISADNKIAVVGSDRPGSTAIDVWESIRSLPSDNWPAMNRTNVLMVESAGSDHDPTLSANGQHLYLAPDNPAPQHITMATRAGSGMFGTPVTIAALDSGTGDADPSPTPDERIIVFSSNRTLAGGGSGDIWYATRASSTGTFSTPIAVPNINTSVPEGDPHLSVDGCRVYFGRDATGGDWDIYFASAQ